jgi:hypothetical protein
MRIYLLSCHPDQVGRPREFMWRSLAMSLEDKGRESGASEVKEKQQDKKDRQVDRETPARQHTPLISGNFSQAPSLAADVSSS